MDSILVGFLLKEIGLPIVAAIIKAKKDAGHVGELTGAEVAMEFVNNVKKWTDQGKAWLAAPENQV